jgi:hypothetical protein
VLRRSLAPSQLPIYQSTYWHRTHQMKSCYWRGVLCRHSPVYLCTKCQVFFHAGFIVYLGDICTEIVRSSLFNSITNLSGQGLCSLGRLVSAFVRIMILKPSLMRSGTAAELIISLAWPRRIDSKTLQLSPVRPGIWNQFCNVDVILKF